MGDTDKGQNDCADIFFKLKLETLFPLFNMLSFMFLSAGLSFFKNVGHLDPLYFPNEFSVLPESFYFC